jgi:hypothetical protein
MDDKPDYQGLSEMGRAEESKVASFKIQSTLDEKWIPTSSSCPKCGQPNKNNKIPINGVVRWIVPMNTMKENNWASHCLWAP